MKINDSVNDLFEIYFKEGDGVFSAGGLWLRGEDIKIKGKIENKVLVVDTILNSPFTYYIKDAFMEF